MWRQTSKKVKDHHVELGFARFTGTRNSVAVIDEPIMILAAARRFEKLGFPMGAYFWGNEDSTREGESEHSYEESIAYYLACAFDEEIPLLKVLEFGEHPPEWAYHPAELVSISLRDGELEANRFSLRVCKTATLALGTKCEDFDETLHHKNLHVIIADHGRS